MYLRILKVDVYQHEKESVHLVKEKIAKR